MRWVSSTVTRPARSTSGTRTAAGHSSASAQLGASTLGVIALTGLGIGSRFGDRLILIILAVFWAWNGVGYHLGFFAEINPAAYGFGAAFLLQAALFLREALRPEPARFRFAAALPGVLAGLGYNGRGVAMASMMGKQLAAAVRGEEIDMPLQPLERFPFHGFRQIGITGAIILGAWRDWLETGFRTDAKR